MGAFKKDEFKSSRGTWSRMLQIGCGVCGKHVCSYQKDGPGNLRRMYIDRIVDPEVSLRTKEFKCLEGHVLGIRITYEKENRPAYRLFVDAIEKKIVSLKDF